MTLDNFIQKLKTEPETIEFSETMAVIDANYDFTPTAFTNSTSENAEGQNSGSCKLFAFAKEQKLSKDEALACFGSYYYDDVLKDAEGKGHQNIRNFMKSGFDGLSFSQDPLKKK
ncbi:HopJ type III effector protein [Zobellia nedashkovskayae]|uniref:HopJ type III effector protein n=1 Tax=Zobellia nedashkovskayae TaxID=2779510 RepID=UPI00188ADDB3|nr:HopJ type III effector protein [Zobellia nedashkovskayae]